MTAILWNRNAFIGRKLQLQMYLAHYLNPKILFDFKFKSFFYSLKMSTIFFPFILYSHYKIFFFISRCCIMRRKKKRSEYLISYIKKDYSEEEKNYIHISGQKKKGYYIHI